MDAVLPPKSDNEFSSCIFLNRLHSLQRLCSNSDERYPNALLFMTGPDGRYNKGSLNILKYLFQGATGKYLLEGSLDEFYEPLEELVILIQQTSVSVLWSNASKKIIGPILSKVPLLIEYLPTIGEESEVDTFQARKCVDFKRMMLEAVPIGRGVGIPVPLGYDELQEVETWPLLQSFAMDDVFCSTGFFTSNYIIVDITEYIDVLFKTVDGFVVEKAIEVLRSSVIPHVEQTVGILDTTSADQRSRLTAEEVAGPFDMLFEFGELDCSFPVDPLMKPVVYFGLDTVAIGAVSVPDGWQKRTVGKKSLISTIEACEPSTGLRWCRTYFLHRGKCFDFTPTGDMDEDNLNSARCVVAPEISSCVYRLEAVYGKLLVGLRATVKYAFSIYTDVLEAGTFVQQSMGSFMRGKPLPGFESLSSSASDDYADTQLLPSERLKLHMDCMNAHGQIVTIDDVDDMGGSCWTYIRVSVHGIAYINDQTLTVAVGDTFLFSSYSGLLDVRNCVTPILAASSFKQIAKPSSGLLAPIFADCFCVTHSIPYFRLFFGPGVEDIYSQRLLASSRSPHMLQSLGLGQLLDTSASTGSLSCPVITDHPLYPHMTGEYKAFSEGLIIEKLDTRCLPLLICMHVHVERMWIVDVEECMGQALTLVSHRDKEMPDFLAPEGNIVILRLRVNDAIADDFDQQDTAGLDASLTGNPLKIGLPGFTMGRGKGRKKEPHHIAFFISTGSRLAQKMNQACASWRNILEANNIQVHRGGDVIIPQGILLNFLAFIDDWSHRKSSQVFDESVLADPSVFVRIAEEYGSRNSLKQTHMGLGFSALRCVHALAESKRMNPKPDTAFKSDDTSSAPSEVQEISSGVNQLSLSLTQTSPNTTSSSGGNAVDMIIVSGLSGSGVQLIGYQIYSRLRKAFTSASSTATYPPTIGLCQLDIAMMMSEAEHAPGSKKVEDMILTNIREAASRDNKDSGSNSCILVVIVIYSPVFHIRHSDLLQFIAGSLVNIASVAQLVSVISSGSSNLSVPVTITPSGKMLSQGCGLELWSASDFELAQPSLCDLVIYIEAAPVQNSGSYRDLKDWLTQANPTLNTLKITPTSLRVNDEIFEELVSKLSKGLPQQKSKDTIGDVFVNKKLKPSNRPVNRQLSDNPIWISRGFGISYGKLRLIDQFLLRRTGGGSPSNSLSLRSLKQFQILPAAPGQLWSPHSLVKTLNALFPSATVSNNVQTDTWNASPPSSTESKKNSIWSRLTVLARIKVFTARQYEEEKKRHEEKTSSFGSSLGSDFVNLSRGIISVNGILRIRSGNALSNVSDVHPSHSINFSSSLSSTQKFVHLEANKGAIILRPIDDVTSIPECLTSNVNCLQIYGAMNQSEVENVRHLVSFCGEYKLGFVSKVVASDLSNAQRLDIQSKAQHIPLPSNIWYDGLSYIDSSGMRKEFRTDIDQLVDEYLDRKNMQVERYNHIISASLENL